MRKVPKVLTMIVWPRLKHQDLSRYDVAYCTGLEHCKLARFSSVQDGVYVLGKAYMRSTPFLRNVHIVAFETVPTLVWLTMALSPPFKDDRLALPLSTPLFSGWLMVWCPWLVPAASVSNSSTLQIFREASHLWRLLCLPVYLLCRFPSLGHVQGSTPTVFEGRCRPLAHSTLGIPFHFSLCVAVSLKAMRMMACVVGLSPLDAIQRRAWVTASTSIAKLEVETVLYRPHCLHGW